HIYPLSLHDALPIYFRILVRLERFSSARHGDSGTLLSRTAYLAAAARVRAVALSGAGRLRLARCLALGFRFHPDAVDLGADREVIRRRRCRPNAGKCSAEDEES